MNLCNVIVANRTKRKYKTSFEYPRLKTMFSYKNHIQVGLKIYPNKILEKYLRNAH